MGTETLKKYNLQAIQERINTAFIIQTAAASLGIKILPGFNLQIYSKKE